MQSMLSLFDSQPAPLPVEGLRYLPGYLPEEEAARLLTIIDEQPWLTDLRRRVQHYGYKYDYTRRDIDRSLYLGPLPKWASRLAMRLHDEGLTEAVPDQLIVNEYAPGQGISPHIDCIPCFGPTIHSLSLGSHCEMSLLHSQTGEKQSLILEPGSLLALQGEARYVWRHSIPARKSDIVNGITVKRTRRVSLTFRTVILALPPSS
jgi:alkylated DNA repair dioxygenase AlkB